METQAPSANKMLPKVGLCYVMVVIHMRHNKIAGQTITSNDTRHNAGSHYVGNKHAGPEISRKKECNIAGH